jgi:hypothetical protein
MGDCGALCPVNPRSYPNIVGLPRSDRIHLDWRFNPCIHRLSLGDSTPACSFRCVRGAGLNDLDESCGTLIWRQAEHPQFRNNSVPVEVFSISIMNGDPKTRLMNFRVRFQAHALHMCALFMLRSGNDRTTIPFVTPADRSQCAKGRSRRDRCDGLVEQSRRAAHFRDARAHTIQR